MNFLGDSGKCVVESLEFESEKNQILEDGGYSKEVYEDFRASFDNVLARMPELYPEVIEGSGIRLFKTRTTGAVPECKIWYRDRDADNLDLLYIERVNEENDDFNSEEE